MDREQVQEDLKVADIDQLVDQTAIAELVEVDAATVARVVAEQHDYLVEVLRLDGFVHIDPLDLFSGRNGASHPAIHDGSMTYADAGLNAGETRTGCLRVGL